MVGSFIIAALVGVAIGVLSGLLGIGGGTIMVPVFRLAFGLSALTSTATSLFTIIPTSVSGAIAHIRNKTCIPKLGIAMGLGGACTSPLGVWLANLSPSWAVMLAAAIVIGYSAFTMVKKALRAPGTADAAGGIAGAAPGGIAGAAADGAGTAAGAAADGAGAADAAGGIAGTAAATADATDGAAAGDADGSRTGEGRAVSPLRRSEGNVNREIEGLSQSGGQNPEPPGARAASSQMAEEKALRAAKEGRMPLPTFTRKQLAVGFCIGLIAGVASGYVGLGGGFLMVPLMLAWVGLPMKQASGTSLIGIMILAIPGAVTQGLLGNIDYLVGIATAVGSIPGALAGARLVTRVPERTLRVLFAAFLGVGAVLLVVKEVGVLG